MERELTADRANIRGNGKRILTFDLSAKAYESFRKLARERSCSDRELILLALGLNKLVADTLDQGNKIVICTAAGKPLKEIVLSK